MLVSICFLTRSQQRVFSSRKEARAAIENDEYATSSGWIIKLGDKVTLGQGSMPGRKFAFILEESSYVLDERHHKYHREMLHHNYRGRVVEVSNFAITGNKSMGFRILAKIKVGQVTRYMVDVENALESGELVMPGPGAPLARPF
jgi:hypothetical protein